MKIFGPKLNGYTLQESGNYFMDNIIYFHDLVLVVLLFILMLVIWFLFFTLLYFGFPNYYRKLILILDFTILFILVFLELAYLLYNRIYVKIYILSYAFKKVCEAEDKLELKKNIYSYIYEFSGIIYKTIINACRYLYVEATHRSFILPRRLNRDLVNLYFRKVGYGKRLTNIFKFLKKRNVEYRYYFYSDVKLEFIWTVFPSLILLFLAIPSFGLLFSIEKVSAPEITIKVIGHQWYWEYQYMDYINFKKEIDCNNNKLIYLNKEEDNYIIESYMIADEDLSTGQFRLLEVDKKLMLPINTSIRLLITSDDVLHSWAIPSLGIKVDACPGRLNEIIIKIRENGIYYGQCSELCGWYHGFMPIVIQTLSREDYKIWAMSSFLDIKYIKNK